MADFCRQCSEELFGEDYGDLANLGDGSELKSNEGWSAICEGCGFTLVDDKGNCLGVCEEPKHKRKEVKCSKP
jgi:hypothetical protein